MQREPESFDLKTLAAQTGVAPRTVHFYVQQGLLPPPDGAGRGARYSAVHRDRLRLIRRLQDQHLPLAEIRKQLDRIPDHLLEEVASAPAPPKPKSAADYIRSVLSSSTPPPLAAKSPVPGSSRTPGSFRVASRPPAPGRVESRDIPFDTFAEVVPPASAPFDPPPGTSRSGTDRSQWERFIVDPDVEIHVRRPGSRASNRKVDKLIDFARSIFKEDA